MHERFVLGKCGKDDADCLGEGKFEVLIISSIQFSSCYNP
jgi:hypothetical protein